ncbi:MAG: carboxypeptidase regulatory-like domain-containing protein [Planctomycetes bacterium]|nr:carboxypeptidase regulatory-like domain-containing protein [Planctomycetota bacterium]
MSTLRRLRLAAAICIATICILFRATAAGDDSRPVRTIIGKIVNAESRPVAGAEIVLGSNARDNINITHSDTEGTFTITATVADELAANHYDLEIRAPGLATSYFNDIWLSGNLRVDLGWIGVFPKCKVHGTVQSADDKPIARAEIYVLPERDAHFRVEPKALPSPAAISDASGTYELTEFGPGNYSLLIKAPGFATVRLMNNRIDAGKDNIFTIYMEPTRIAEVTVLDPFGEPVEGAEIRITGDLSIRYIYNDLFQQSERYITDSKGGARIDGISSHGAEFRLWKFGYQHICAYDRDAFGELYKLKPGKQTIIFEQIPVLDIKTTRPFGKPAKIKAVSLQVGTADGEQFVGTEEARSIQLIADDHWRISAIQYCRPWVNLPSGVAVAAEDGSFGSINDLFKNYGFAEQTPLPHAKRGEILKSLEMQLSRSGHVHATVVDSDEKPVDHAFVKLGAVESFAGLYHPSTFTNKSGQFEFNDVPESEGWIAISSERCELTTVKYAVKSGETQQLTIRTNATQKLKGHVKNPAADATSPFVLEIAAKEPNGTKLTVITDLDGKFECDAPLGGGVTMVAPNVPGFRNSVRNMGSHYQYLNERAFGADTAADEFIINIPPPAPMSGLRGKLSLNDHSAQPYYISKSESFAGDPRYFSDCHSNSRGEFEIAAYVAGTYHLSIQGNGFHEIVECQIPQPENKQFTIQLRSTRVAGRVVDSTGNPIVARLLLKREREDPKHFYVEPFREISTADGSYQFDGIPLGKYTLTIRDPDCTHETITIPSLVVGPAKNEITDRIVMRPCATLHIVMKADIDANAVFKIEATPKRAFEINNNDKDRQVTPPQRAPRDCRFNGFPAGPVNVDITIYDNNGQPFDEHIYKEIAFPATPEFANLEIDLDAYMAAHRPLK